MFQPKFFTHLLAGEALTSLRNGAFRQIAVFKFLYVALNEFAREIALGPTGAFGQFR